MSTKNRYDSLHILRGLAALAVMFCHFSWILRSAYGDAPANFFRLGYLGVDIFFMISGFVISLSTENSAQNLNGVWLFIKHRLKRILPAYYFWLLVAFLLSGAMSTFHYQEKIDNFIGALTLTPVTSKNPPLYQDVDSVYGIRWTLIYEMFFYLLMAFSIFFKNRIAALMSMVIFFVFIAPIIYGSPITLYDTGINSSNKYINLITNPIILLFAAGVLLQRSAKKINHIPLKARRILGVALIATSFILIANTKQITHDIMSGGFFMCLVFIAAILNEDLFHNRTPKALLFLGDISFSLYLIHTLMNSGLSRRWDKLDLPGGWIEFIAYSLLSIIFAYASYKYIERPLLRKK